MRLHDFVLDILYVACICTAPAQHFKACQNVEMQMTPDSITNQVAHAPVGEPADSMTCYHTWRVVVSCSSALLFS